MDSTPLMRKEKSMIILFQELCKQTQIQFPATNLFKMRFKTIRSALIPECWDAVF